MKAGANINFLENDRYDGITIASVAADEDTLRLLISLGADLQLADRAGNTTLALARQRGYATMVRMLEAAGPR